MSEKQRYEAAVEANESFLKISRQSQKALVNICHQKGIPTEVDPDDMNGFYEYIKASLADVPKLLAAVDRAIFHLAFTPVGEIVEDGSNCPPDKTCEGAGDCDKCFDCWRTYLMEAK